MGQLLLRAGLYLMKPIYAALQKLKAPILHVTYAFSASLAAYVANW
jgi:hypothetical protein